ncbi:hypothetical protein IWQ57_004151 [Coemansia nantahalensis]|uniref:Uncharacterized protein n=1 Tax=Coemansia nantahalensis TaxID=2789366 RepID=A0ACC1JTV5_9FUNG|nr:hypothetical protein IWQ57_004151 [Coemansia nantahalensis]
MVRRRRLLVFTAAQLVALWLLCLLIWDPRTQTGLAAAKNWLNQQHLYPCAFLKQPAVFVHDKDHYYVVWETTCGLGTPILEWWAEAPSEPAPAHHYTQPVYRRLDAVHHRYSAIIGPVHGAARVSYQASSYRLSSRQHTFVRRGQDDRTRVLVMSDNQNGPTVFRRVLSQIQRHYGRSDGGPDAVLHLGDTVQNVDSLTDWQTQLFSPMEGGGGYLQRAPLAFVPGNHDHDKRRAPDNANVYANMYHGLHSTDDLRKATTEGNHHRFYYSASIGGARLIVLDAECPSEEQTTFLEQELQSAAFQTARFRIVAVHIPPYMEFWDPYTWNDKGEKHWGEHIRLEYDRLFRTHHVDLVVSGHQHNYQRSTVRRDEDPARSDTITYAIVGGAGGDLDLKRVEDWHMYNTTFLGHHFVSLEIDARRLDWTAYDIDGAVVDRFAIER